MANRRGVFYRRFFLAIVAGLFVASASAQEIESQFSQWLAWQANGDALEYKVEIVNDDTKESTFYTTEENFIRPTLPAGNYRYRVFAYDFLGRESGVSEWETFVIHKASQPEITRVEKELVAPEDGEQLEINLDIANIAPGSTVELVNEGIKGVIVGQDGGKKASSETDSANKVTFDHVPPGKWRIRVTNPSGLTTESDVIEVKERPPVVIEKEVVKEVEKEILVDNNSPRGIPAGKDIIFGVGAGAVFRLYDTSLADYSYWQIGGADIIPSVTARVTWLPFRRTFYRAGAEFSGWVNRFTKQEDYYKLTLSFLRLQLSGVFQYAILHKRLFISGKLGGGVCLINKDVDYHQENSIAIVFANRRAAAVDSTETGIADKRSHSATLGYPAVSAGLSLFWIPARFVALELGADFAHIFAAGMPTGMLTPYLSVGFRL